jgi:flotillin
VQEIIATLFSALVAGVGIAVGVVLFIAFVRQFLFIGRPNEVLIFSGRQQTMADGTVRGYRELIGGGRSFRWPLIEQVARMDLSTIPVEVKVANAFSKGGITLSVHAVANVKVSAQPAVVRNAIERFLGRDPAEIRRVAKETLEGHLRGVLATLTPEEVNEDRLKFADALVEEAGNDFHKLGLQLDTLKVQHVADDRNYLDSIGRKRIAEVVRDAEMAESFALTEAQKIESESTKVATVARQNAETIVVQAENSVRQLKAELEAEARTEEEQAEAAWRQARAEAEAELQDIRRQLEHLRLQADVVLPAQAAQEAAALRARGDAAAIAESGKAMADVLQMMTDTWLAAGPDARDIFLIQQLETVLKTVVTRVSKVAIGEVNLIDGGDGTTLPRHIASFPASVRAVLDELKGSTGVDVTGMLSGAVRPLGSVQVHDPLIGAGPARQES